MTKKKETKLVHLQILNGTTKELRAFGEALNVLKSKLDLPYNIEFIVTNERITLHGVKYLLEHLHDLYKKEKKLREKK